MNPKQDCSKNIHARYMLFSVLFFGLVSLISIPFSAGVNVEHYKSVLGINDDANSQNSQGSVLSETNSTVERDRCIAGYNGGGGISTDEMNKISDLGLGYNLIIVSSKGEASRVRSLVKEANSKNIEPVVRLCWNDKSDGHCGDFKSSEGLISFINDINSGFTNEDYFYSIVAGPNEPLTETWLINNDSNISNDDYAKTLADYVRDVATSDANNDNVNIITPAFNLHACSSRVDFINKFIYNLGDDGRNALEGFVGNSYGPGANDCYINNIRQDVLKTNGFETIIEPGGQEVNPFTYNHGNPLPFYMTEFGILNESQSIADIVKPYRELEELPETKAVLFFKPFAGLGNGEFSKHEIDETQLKNLTNCSKSTVVEKPPVSESKDFKRVCVPYAKYYKEDYISHELLSCEKTKGLAETELVGWFKLYPSEIEENLFEGNMLISAKINNFPELNHYGSGSSQVVENPDGPGIFGTPKTPYEPICTIIGKLIGNNQLVTSREHHGELRFYGGGEQVFSYALEKLGSGVGCLNLLSMLNPNSPEKIEGGSVSEDYMGFNVLLEDECLTDTQEAIRLSQAAAKTKDIRPVEEERKTIFEEIFDIAKNFTPDYAREYEDYEPHVDYEKVDYCADNDDGIPEIKYINKLANEKSESINGPEQIVANYEIKINLDEYCSNPTLPKDEQLLLNGTDAHYQLCSNEKLIVSSNEISDLFLLKKISAPTQVGMPGALAGLGKLFEHVQLNAPDGLKLIAPQNGTIFDGSVRLLDPNKEEYEDMTKYGMIKWYDELVSLNRDADYRSLSSLIISVQNKNTRELDDLEKFLLKIVEELGITGSDLEREITGENRKSIYDSMEKAYPRMKGIEMVNLSFPEDVPFHEATGNNTITQANFEFVLPFEVSTYMRAWLYNYSKMEESDSYNFETNPNLRL